MNPNLIFSLTASGRRIDESNFAVYPWLDNVGISLVPLLLITEDYRWNSMQDYFRNIRQHGGNIMHHPYRYNDLLNFVTDRTSETLTVLPTY